ncbi:MAG TPA: DUF72 domain-containing protein, partial [Dehalococcoidales bacterium]|nr:DUF72 domain-containing protein [Dehalococcoidales bacterium]
MAKILIGISSWAEPELIKTGFYPADVKTPAERLKYYASQFSVAEIDSTYHFFPSRHNLDLWLENTPDGFKFNVRAYSLFTGHPTQFASLPGAIREKYGEQIKARSGIYPHHLSPEAADELWEIFKRNIERFQSAGKLGTVFFQFPPWFHATDQANYEIVAQCSERLKPYRMAAEFRTPGWVH